MRRKINTEHEAHLVQAVSRRAPIAARWFNDASEESMAKDFAAAVCNIRSTHLTRFVSSVLTQAPLPTKAAIHRWGISTHTDIKCPLCKTEVQTPRHILAGCRVALDQGRYTFRHDFILRALAYHVSESPHTALSFRPTWHATPSNVASRQ